MAILVNGTPGNSTSLPVSTLVTLTSSSGSTFAWVLAAKPAGSATALSGAGTGTCTMTPDTHGMYLVTALIDGVMVRVVLGVRLASGLLPLAAGVDLSVWDFDWSEEANNAFRVADTAKTNAATAQGTANAAQVGNANLTAFAGLTGLADRLFYFTGTAALALAVFTAFGRSLIAAVDAAAAKALLSLTKGDVGLGNVDNTSDTLKPASTAQAALNTAMLKKDGSVAMTGALDMGTHQIGGVVDPTTAQQAATKNYVDTHAASSPTTTKGDLYTHSTVDARLPVGSDGQILLADSSQATGLVWRQNPVQIITATFSGPAGSLTMTWTLNGVAQTPIALGAGTWRVLPLFAGLNANESAAFSTLIIGRRSGVAGGNVRHVTGLAVRAGDTKVRCGGYSPTLLTGINGSSDPSLPQIPNGGGAMVWGYCEADPDGAPTRPAGMLAISLQHDADLTTYWQVITTLARVAG